MARSFLILFRINQGTQFWRRNYIEITFSCGFPLKQFPLISDLHSFKRVHFWKIQTKKHEFHSQPKKPSRIFNFEKIFCWLKANELYALSLTQSKKKPNNSRIWSENTSARITTATSSVFISRYRCYCRIIDGQSTPPPLWIVCKNYWRWFSGIRSMVFIWHFMLILWAVRLTKSFFVWTNWKNSVSHGANRLFSLFSSLIYSHSLLVIHSFYFYSQSKYFTSWTFPFPPQNVGFFSYKNLAFSVIMSALNTIQSTNVKWKLAEQDFLKRKFDFFYPIKMFIKMSVLIC